MWLKQHLGAPVAVWRDEKKLGGDHAFDDEIKSQIESSAVFLAVVTPLYLNSRYCTQEREWFLESVGKNLFVGSRMRGIRVVKTPQSDGSHRGVFSEGLGFDFFGAVEGDVDEFAPASREFDDRFGKVCKSIKGLLETLRRDRVSVYVAHCPSDLQSEREKLVTEFNDQGYRILPEIQIDSKNVDKVAKDGLEAARLSVHLRGVESDSLAVRQARIAMELEKPLIAWSSKPELYIGETKYGNFLRELMEYQDPLRQSQLSRPHQVGKSEDRGPGVAATQSGRCAGDPQRWAAGLPSCATETRSKTTRLLGSSRHGLSIETVSK